MARLLYGLGSGDYVSDGSGVIQPGTTVTLWTHRVGGSQVTDVLGVTDVTTVNGSGVVTALTGVVGVFGPDGYYDDLWAQSGSGARVRLSAPDSSDRIDEALEPKMDTSEALETFVSKGGLGVNVEDYGPAGDNSSDDTAVLQAAIDAAAAVGAPVIFGRRKSYRVTTLTIPAKSVLVGNRATLSTVGDAPILDVTGAEVAINDLIFIGDGTGGGGETKQNQYGIRAWAPVTMSVQLWVSGCRFHRLQSCGMNVKNYSDVSFTDNYVRHYGYAGFIGYGCTDVVVTGNTFEGTRSLPSWAGNSYAVSLSAYEPDGVPGSASAPRSSEIVISNNTIRRQCWAGIDTHVGQRVTISGNTLHDSPAVGINCVFISMSSPSGGDLSPQGVTITGNTLWHPTLNETHPDMHIGIALSGSQTAVTGRERVTGAITGNAVYRYGRKDSTVSGGIMVRSGRGVTVSGNSLVECRSYGVNLIDSGGVTVTGNTVVDVWKSAGETAVAFYAQAVNDSAADCDVTLSGNVVKRGTVSGSFAVNTSAVSGTTTIPYTLGAGNEFNGTPVNTNIDFRSRLGRNVEVEGTAAPVSGTWVRGDRIRNTAPTAGGNLGWVCVTSGTPGTWKSFGTISA